MIVAWTVLSLRTERRYADSANEVHAACCLLCRDDTERSDRCDVGQAMRRGFASSSSPSTRSTQALQPSLATRPGWPLPFPPPTSVGRPGFRPSALRLAVVATLRWTPYGDQGARAKDESLGPGTLGVAQKQPGGLPPQAATRVQHSPPVCVRQQHSTSTTFHRASSAPAGARQRAVPPTRGVHGDSADAIPWLAPFNTNAITMVRSMAARLIARPNARKPRLCAASRE